MKEESCEPHDIFVSLKEHFDSRFSAIEKATDLARHAMENRLEGMNQIRNQLNRQAETFVTREGYDNKHDALAIRIESLERAAIKAEGKRTGFSNVWAIVISIIGLIASLGLIINAIRLFMDHQ